MKNGVTYELFLNKRKSEETQKCCEKNYMMDKKMSVMEIVDGVVLPGMAGLGGIVCESGFVQHSAVHRSCGGSYCFAPESVVNEDAEVVYIGMMWNVWGHCLTDNLKHLWFLFDDRYSFLKELKCVYTMAYGDGFRPDDNFCQLLEHLGINIQRCERVNRVTKYKKIYLPDDCFVDMDDCKFYTVEFKRIIDNLIDKVLQNGSNPIYSKVYFSRANLENKDKDYGEKSIEDFFKKQGYNVFYPETLSFDQQVFLLQQCDSFATTEGSIAHNAMFLKERTQLILIRKANYCNGYQFAINHMKRLKVVLIDAHLSVCANPVSPWNGPFYLYVSKKMLDFFHVKNRYVIEGGGKLFCKYIFNNGLPFLKRRIKETIKKWNN